MKNNTYLDDNDKSSILSTTNGNCFQIINKYIILKDSSKNTFVVSWILPHTYLTNIRISTIVVILNFSQICFPFTYRWDPHTSFTLTQTYKYNTTTLHVNEMVVIGVTNKLVVFTLPFH